MTARDGMWRRFGGDDWAAFDALPAPVRQRLYDHAYDAWACSKRAMNTLLRKCTD